jgi:hypothetical protein
MLLHRIYEVCNFNIVFLTFLFSSLLTHLSKGSLYFATNLILLTSEACRSYGMARIWRLPWLTLWSYSPLPLWSVLYPVSTWSWSTHSFQALSSVDEPPSLGEFLGGWSGSHIVPSLLLTCWCFCWCGWFLLPRATCLRFDGGCMIPA